MGGTLVIDNKERHDLRFMVPKELPPMFNQQMQDIVVDILAGKCGVYR